jgi:hypothetical protein
MALQLMSVATNGRCASMFLLRKSAAKVGYSKSLANVVFPLPGVPRTNTSLSYNNPLLPGLLRKSFTGSGLTIAKNASLSRRNSVARLRKGFSIRISVLN